MPHRIREAWMSKSAGGKPYNGPVEVGETYVGGKEEKHAERQAQGTGGRGAGLEGARGRREGPGDESGLRAVTNTTKPTFQGFVAEPVALDATVYTYEGMPFKHELVKHAVRHEGLSRALMQNETTMARASVRNPYERAATQAFPVAALPKPGPRSPSRPERLVQTPPQGPSARSRGSFS